MLVAGAHGFVGSALACGGTGHCGGNRRLLGVVEPAALRWRGRWLAACGLGFIGGALACGGTGHCRGNRRLLGVIQAAAMLFRQWRRFALRGGPCHGSGDGGLFRVGGGRKVGRNAVAGCLACSGLGRCLVGEALRLFRLVALQTELAEFVALPREVGGVLVALGGPDLALGESVVVD